MSDKAPHPELPAIFGRTPQNAYTLRDTHLSLVPTPLVARPLRMQLHGFNASVSAARAALAELLSTAEPPA